ncbi:hypothetical protein [Myroides sp. WP-1]|uniref:hypothetical protein n=1 Tax=Myroides sp. WP-1 TaxID=2759944 RepID=UPI0015F9E0DA|nr:hypothetical protein [Myroides sp. WP-1]MBB1138951.1 hypothetical protein [Myroides sp. WP-1]
MKFNNFEKLLPLGYLFLVLLGIIKQSVFYNQFGINILDYSSLMDILISPISDLTSHSNVFLFLLVFLTIIFFVFLYFSKNHEKPWVQKFFKSNRQFTILTKEEIQLYLGNRFLLLASFGLIAFFLGMGIGTGKKTKERIEKEDLSYDYLLKIDNTEKQVHLIGVNSLNYFYLEKGNKNIKISPSVSVKSIEYLHTEEKK